MYKKVFILLIVFSLLLTACVSNGKPSKEDVIKKIEKINRQVIVNNGEELTKSDEEENNKYSICITNVIYGKFSSQELTDLINSKSQDLDEVFNKLDNDDLNTIAACIPGYGSEKVSNSKAILKSAAVSVLSIQTAKGDSDFSGITLAELGSAEPEFEFVNTVLSADAKENKVAILDITSSLVTMQSRNGNLCYFIALSTGSPATTYGKTELYEAEETCPPAPISWDEDQNIGWK